MKSVAIVGAGFSGAVIARELALAGFSVDLFDGRSHVAGNCHTSRDEETGVMLHVYGPHIFHTSNKVVWDYVNQFDEFSPFVNRVKAVSGRKIYSLPINLMTINNFFDVLLSPEEAKLFVESKSDRSIDDPVTFEDQALRYVGRELYEAFFKGYTLKQWGIHPSKLPASILKRLPVRFNYNDSYYESRYQGIPRNGYTFIVERMLDHPNISIHLGTLFDRSMAAGFSHVFYSGPIDGWFSFSEGRLGYRTLDFSVERYHGDYQGNAVINYCNEDVPYTRVCEHKHFTDWESHEDTVIYRESSRSCNEGDVPYYPIRLVGDKSLLRRYVDMGKLEPNVTFVGRLGTYRYLDMHVTIGEALQAAQCFLENTAKGFAMPAFTVDPLAS